MLEVEPNGNFFIGSNYDNTVFKTGNLVLPENKGLNDVFILYCNADGKILSHITFGGKDIDWIKDAVKDQNDDLYILGMYLSDTLYIGSNLLINSNTDRSSDLYIAKLSKDSLNYIRPIVKSNSISVHPNPASNDLFLTIPNHWDENKNIIISLVDHLGKEIKLSSEKISKYEYSINTKLLNNGGYYLKFISGENSEVVKIMIQH
ncbi:MAG: T9SS type A sorting domain-containing protein [Saprospiraceae bacterium]